MIQYIYFVKCPNCEDEHFDFFDEAKEFALGCLSQKPIITQIEVNRNDFGECTDSCDLGTVWSWEDMMKETDAEPAQSVFTKADLDNKCSKHDAEFDDEEFFFDNNLIESAAAKMSFKNKEEQSEFFRLCSEIGIITGADLRRFMSENTADGSALLSKLRAYRAELGDDFKIEEAMVEHVNEEHPVIESDQELSGIDNCVVPCKVAKVVAHSEDEKPVTCKKPIPEGMTIEQLVEAMEENEDTVECSMCEELFLKADGVKNGYSYICPTCSTTDDTADAFNQEFPEVEPDTAKEFSETDIGRIVADLVVDEFEAISNYEAATDAIQHSKIPEEKQVEILDTLDHIRKEEEEHIEELKAITTVEDHVLDEELATDETVQCAGCEESFPKDECIHKEDIGYLCSDCEDCIVKCTWCEDLYDRSECRREVDLGWLCSRCEMAIKSRGETLTFREGGYWDFLAESIDDSKTLADLVKDSINHLTNDIGKDPWAEDFADDVIADIENNYDIEVPANLEKYCNWASAIACEVSRQVNNQYPLEEEIDELTEASLSDITNAINSEYGTSWNSTDLLDSTGIEDELGNIAYGINSEEPARKILDNRPLADIERFAQKYRKKKKAMVFNRKYRRHIQQFDDFPAIDPDTNELTYDKARKNEILDLVYKEHDAIVDKTRQAVARAREKAATRYKWTVEYTINGKTINRSTVLGDSTTPEEASQVLIDRIKGAEREALAFGEPFEWNGKVKILKCKKPGKTEEVFTEACEADIPSALKEGELPEVSKSHLKFCPECGKNAFDTETGICVDCGFN